jgi:hypothetical protein
VIIRSMGNNFSFEQDLFIFDSENHDWLLKCIQSMHSLKKYDFKDQFENSSIVFIDSINGLFLKKDVDDKERFYFDRKYNSNNNSSFFVRSTSKVNNYLLQHSASQKWLIWNSKMDRLALVQSKEEALHLGCFFFESDPNNIYVETTGWHDFISGKRMIMSYDLDRNEMVAIHQDDNDDDKHMLNYFSIPIIDQPNNFLSFLNNMLNTLQDLSTSYHSKNSSVVEATMSAYKKWCEQNKDKIEKGYNEIQQKINQIEQLCSTTTSSTQRQKPSPLPSPPPTSTQQHQQTTTKTAATTATTSAHVFSQKSLEPNFVLDPAIVTTSKPNPNRLVKIKQESSDDGSSSGSSEDNSSSSSSEDEDEIQRKRLRLLQQKRQLMEIRERREQERNNHAKVIPKSSISTPPQSVPHTNKKLECSTKSVQPEETGLICQTKSFFKENFNTILILFIVFTVLFALFFFSYNYDKVKKMKK